MANNIELESNSASWDQHNERIEHDDPSSALQMAQATSSGQAAGETTPSAAPTSEPKPVDVGATPAQTGQQTATTPPANGEYTVGADKIVHLPVNTSIDNIRVEGTNLALQQADGSVVVIKDGAIDVPTFIVGDIEFPRVALLAALQTSGVDVAFGADGSISAGQGTGSNPSAGGNFEHAAGGIGNGFDLSGLLPPTELQFGGGGQEELYPAFVNRDPSLADFAVLSLSEEGLVGGNADNDGSSDTTNATLITGRFPATDADGDTLSFTFGEPSGLTSGGVPVVWSGQGTAVLVGSVNGVTVITITATGDSYTIQILGPIDHPNDARPGSEDDLTLVVPVTATDGKGGSTTANMSVTIEDDSPAFVGAGQTVLRVDEDGLASANADAGRGGENNFGNQTVSHVELSTVINPGADGLGSYHFASGALTQLASLGLSSNHTAIAYSLSADGRTITGSAGGVSVFTVELTATGSLTFTLLGQVDHSSNPGDAENSLTLDLSGLVEVTDRDGDALTPPAGSVVVSIGDDIPVAVVGEGERGGVHAGVAEDGLSTDQGDASDGNLDGGQDSNSDEASGAAGSLNTLFKAGADAPLTFSVNLSTDGLPVLYSHGFQLVYSVSGDTLTATANGVTVFTLTVNADGSWAFDLQDQLDHVNANGDEGTQLRSVDGTSINAIDFSSVIVATDADGDRAAGAARSSFTITVQNDVPVVVGGEGQGEGEGPVRGIHAGVAEDGLSMEDGDSSNGNLDAGQSTSSDEASGGAGSLDMLFKAGADEPLRFSVDLSKADLPQLYSHGIPLVYTVSPEGHTLTATVGETTVFTLTVNSDGSWAFDLKDQLDHVNANGDEGSQLRNGSEGSVSFIDFSSVIVATDSDGDKVMGAARGSFTITVQNDVPVAVIDGKGIHAGVAEDGLSTDQGDVSTGNLDAGQTTSSDEASGNAGSLNTLFKVGADEPLRFSVDLSKTDLPQLYSHGIPLVYTVSPDGHTLVATAGETTVFTLTVNTDGSWAFDLKGQLDHVNANGDEGTRLRTGEESSVDAIDFSSVIVATDSDGDRAIGATKDSFTITVQNDVPLAALSVREGGVVVVDESLGQNGASETEPEGTLGQVTVLGSSLFDTNGSSAGADSAGATTVFSLEVVDGGHTGLYLTGKSGSENEILLVDKGSGLIEGRVGGANGTLAFSIQINGSNGNVTLTQYESLNHPTGGLSHDEAIYLAGGALRAVYTVTDGDKDVTKAEVDLGKAHVIVFEDDGPKIDATKVGSLTALVVDETVLGMDATFQASNLFTTAVNYGADGAGKTSYALQLSAAGVGSGLFAVDPAVAGGKGAEITLTLSGNVVTGSVGGTPYFTITLDNTGKITLDQVKAIWHANTGDADDASILSKLNILKLVATATDADGDSTSHTIDLGAANAFVFEDDGPTAGSNSTVYLDDETAKVNYSTPNTGGTGDYDGVTPPPLISGVLSHGYGADGAGSVLLSAITLPATGGFGYVLSANKLTLTITQVQNGATVDVMKISLTNSSSGAYIVEHLKPVFHPTSSTTEENLDFVVKYDVKDADGDVASSGTLTINVDDDTPTAADDFVTTNEQPATNFNVAFVLDFSGSIDNTELATMLNAVKQAAQAIFAGTAGDVRIELVAFSSDALAAGPFTSYAALEAQLNAWSGSGRPFDGGTDFTAGIEKTMEAYQPLFGYSNQVFFLSDGNPTDNTGTGGNSLADTTAANWNNFVDGNHINVTTIGVGNGIDNTRLQDVDLDGSGSPIQVANFNDLVQTLLNLVQVPPITGNVLSNDGGFGADGGRILSISVDGVVFTWNGTNQITSSAGGAAITGTSFTANTSIGGVFTFYFASGGGHAAGDWSYRSPLSVSQDRHDLFTYVVRDGDGDLASAKLDITVKNINGVPVAGSSNGGTVDEDGLRGGNSGDSYSSGDAPGNATALSGHLAYAFGSDGPAASGAISFSTVTGIPAGLKSGGIPLTYAWNPATNILTATAGMVTVFTLAVTNVSTGAYAFNLYAPLDHGVANKEDDIKFDFSFTVKDANNDTATGSLGITVNDDAPRYTGATDGAIGNVAGQVEGVINGSFGGDGPGAILLTPITALPGVTYSAASATADGGMQIVATTGSGAAAKTFFTMTWYPDGHYVFDLVTPRPTTSASTSLKDAVQAGNNPYFTVQNSAGTQDDIVFRAITNVGGGQNTMNRDSNGFGVGTPILTKGDVFDVEFGSAYTVDKISFTVQKYGSQSGDVSFTWIAYNNGVAVDNDTKHLTGVAAGSTFEIDPDVPFDEIRITHSNGKDVQLGFGFTYTTYIPVDDKVVSFGVKYTDADGDSVSGSTIVGTQTVDISLLGSTNDEFDGSSSSDWFTATSASEDFYGDGGIDTVSYAASTAAVSVNLSTGSVSGGFAQGDDLDDIRNLVGSKYADTLRGENSYANTIEGGGGADTLIGGTGGGDTVSYQHSAIDVIVDLERIGSSAQSQQSTGDASGDFITGFENLTGSNFADTLRGDGGDNVLMGLGGNDALYGRAGDDTLHGGVGNDLLVGGADQDTLTGGTGADIFKLDSLDIEDLITDYSGVGGEGDKIDLTALFDATPGNSVNDYVRYDSTTHTLSVDTDGAATGTNFVDVAVLQNAPATGTITILYDDTLNPSKEATI